MAGDARAAAAAPPRTSLGDVAARIGEATALVVAVTFALGAFSILGQLRQLGLHQPSVVSGFAHDDVLMKGVGVLFTHAPSLLTLGLLLTLALSGTARAWMRSHVVIRAEGPRLWRLVFFAGFGLLVSFALLASSWWVGTAGTLVAYGALGAAWLQGRLLSRAALFAVAVLGSLGLGLTGTYLHPVPLPTVSMQFEAGDRLEGYLLGTGQYGERYVVVTDRAGSHVRIVAGADPQSIVLDEPTGEYPRRLLDVLGG
jgi:hypothetical protein